MSSEGWRFASFSSDGTMTVCPTKPAPHHAAPLSESEHAVLCRAAEHGYPFEECVLVVCYYDVNSVLFIHASGEQKEHFFENAGEARAAFDAMQHSVWYNRSHWSLLFDYMLVQFSMVKILAAGVRPCGNKFITGVAFALRDGSDVPFHTVSYEFLREEIAEHRQANLASYALFIDVLADTLA